MNAAVNGDTISMATVQLRLTLHQITSEFNTGVAQATYSTAYIVVFCFSETSTNNDGIINTRKLFNSSK